VLHVFGVFSPHQLILTVREKGQYRRIESRTDKNIHIEQEVLLLGVVANAVVSPGAMVVHDIDAAAALTTVMDARHEG